ncbi:50S ribosomal protein L13 [Thelohanellus kitauei]|uniref:50S ribosomal protein L13 n=1 Tax=Thelohanellus kitauei TaxID=669202 RepID=A0A0C2N2Y8_THEKT|nr:50S ribosomal protein L13 [Thelohanellus kitauei]
MVIVKGAAAGLYHTAKRRSWYLIDANNQTCGRLAQYLAIILQGKTKPIFHRSSDDGDYIVVTNCKYIHFVGCKFSYKIYHHYTGMVGGMKERNIPQMASKDACRLLWKSVYGMLPRNNMRPVFMDRLFLFEYENHPFVKSELVKIQPSSLFPPRITQLTSESLKNYPLIVKNYRD